MEFLTTIVIGFSAIVLFVSACIILAGIVMLLESYPILLGLIAFLVFCYILGRIIIDYDKKEKKER